MDKDFQNNERSKSTEYLAEYGGLIIDVSTFIDTLDQHLPNLSDEQTFTVELIDGPLTMPEEIIDKIGTVHSATVSYGNHPTDPITVELLGATQSYRIARSPDTEEPTDTVIHIPPLDEIDTVVVQKKSYDHLSSEEFEDSIENIPGVSDKVFATILFTLAFPDSQPNYSPDAASRPSVFTPEVYGALRDSTRIASPLRNGFTEYSFLTDEATLVYSYEHGHPSYFQFHCEDDGGDALQFRGTINAHQAVDVSFPRHAVTSGLNGDVVDTTHSFPLTIKEIQRIRAIIAEEQETLPSNVDSAVPLESAEEIPEEKFSDSAVEEFIDDQRKRSEDEERKAWEGIVDDIEEGCRSLLDEHNSEPDDKSDN